MLKQSYIDSEDVHCAREAQWLRTIAKLARWGRRRARLCGTQNVFYSAYSGCNVTTNRFRVTLDMHPLSSVVHLLPQPLSWPGLYCTGRCTFVSVGSGWPAFIEHYSHAFCTETKVGVLCITYTVRVQ